MGGTDFNTITPDFVEVWEKFKKGDKDAFSLLYENFFDLLFRYGMKFVNDEDIVKDCIQDLFIKLYNNRTSLSSTNNPKFYLLLSLKNLIIDYLSKYNRMTYLSPSDLPFYINYQFQVTDDDSNEIDDETRKKFEKVISLLNPRQEEALYLRFQLELSYEEISQLLGINYQSARNLIHRSITKVREQMDVSIFIVLFLKAIN